MAWAHFGLDLLKKAKKWRGGRGGEGVTDCVMERTCPVRTLNLKKNLAWSAVKAIVSVNPKILQLDL